MLNPDNAKTLSESTTRYNSLGRVTYQTTWLTARGAISPALPPIAGLGGVSLSDGLTTQYLYDDNLGDGVGLDNSAGVSVSKLGTSGTGTFNVSLSNAITKLAQTTANGGAGISFSSVAPGRATIVINPEDEISFSIADRCGKPHRHEWQTEQCRTIALNCLENHSRTIALNCSARRFAIKSRKQP